MTAGTGQAPGWVRYWFLTEGRAWPYATIGIDAREVAAGGRVAVTAYAGEPVATMHIDPVQLDELAEQWIEFRKSTASNTRTCEH